MGPRIVFVNPHINEDQKKRISLVADKYGASIAFYSSTSPAIPNLADAEIVYGSSPELIEHAPNIKWFCAASAGIDNYVKSGVFEGRDILLTNSSGAFGLTIAEYIIMMSLYMMRRMPEYDKFIREKVWTGYMPIKNLKDSNIVVLGTGDLGSAFAKRVRAFEPKSLIGVSKSGNPVEHFDRVVKTDDLNDVVSDVDLLVMCLPGTPETTGILSRELIDRMPDSAYVVNVGRGSAVDEDALVSALKEGRLAGATLDVLRTEPLPPESPLWDVPNLYITPHISGQETTDWTKDKNYDMFAEDLENYLSGNPLVYLADIRKGY